MTAEKREPVDHMCPRCGSFFLHVCPDGGLSVDETPYQAPTGKGGFGMRLPALPRKTAGYLVSIVEAGTCSWDHEDGCDLSGESRSCEICVLARWTHKLRDALTAERASGSGGLTP